MNKEELIKRLKSFAWRSLVIFLLGLIAWITNLMPELNIPSVVVAVIGLALNELTKWLNNNTAMFGKALKK